MSTVRFKDHILGPDTHANRPAASGVPEAAIYECTTHGLIYKNVGGSWVTYGTLIPPGGTTGQSLVKNSATDGDVGWGAGGGGGGTTETYDAAITAITGAVHRWKFEETSGATIADSIGSLNLTLSGTAGTNYNRNIAGPSGLGLATQLISARATSSGIGSVPVGSADRTVALVFRTSSQNTQQIPFTWGTSAAYQLFYISLNDSGAAAALGHMTPAVGGGSDLLDMAQVPISDGGWHLAFAGLRGGTGKNRFGYIDGIYAQGTFTTAANTVSTGSFAVSGSGSNQFIGDIADLTVFNKALSRAEMDRMFRAAFPNA